MRMGPEHGDLRGQPPGQNHFEADQRKRRHGRVSFAQADLHAEFARRLLQKPVQQLEHPLLLFQRPKQLPHLLPGEVEIQAYQVGSALHVDLGRPFDVQQPLPVEHNEPFENGVVSGALLLQPAPEFLARFREDPAAEVLVQVVADGIQVVLRDVLLEGHHAVAHHAVARDHHHHDAPVHELQQFDPVQRLAGSRDGSGNADVVGDLGQHVRGSLDAPGQRLRLG